MRPQRPWTIHDDTRLGELWPRMTLSAAAKEMNRTKSQVHGKAIAAGLPSKPRGGSSPKQIERRATARKLRQQGWKYDAIAAKLGLASRGYAHDLVSGKK
jgi:predicted transcriptional regulator